MNPQQIGGILKDLSDLALPTLLFAILTAALAHFVLTRLVTGALGPAALLPFAFAILGGIAGAITGSSMEPLVGALITGVLGIVSAILSYVFAKETDPIFRAVAPVAIILLLLNALAGLSVGQNWKKKWLTYSDLMEEHRLDYKEVWVPTTRAYQQKLLERCLAEYKTTSEAKAHCNVETLFPQ